MVTRPADVNRIDISVSVMAAQLHRSSRGLRVQGQQCTVSSRSEHADFLFRPSQRTLLCFFLIEA